MTCDGVTGGSGLSPRDEALAYQRNASKAPAGRYAKEAQQRLNNGGRVPQGCKSKPKPSRTQQHGAGSNGPPIWNPTAAAQRRGDFAPHQGT